MGDSTVYAVANQKGGVGKTTTAVNMAACIAEAGYETLLVDLDPQCNATAALGLSRDLEPNVYTCLLGAADLRDAARPTGVDSSSWCRRRRTSPARPSSCRASPGRRRGCEKRSAPPAPRFAQIVLDCPPSLGPLAVNALVAADRVIVPVQAEYLALEGLAQFLDTLALIQRELNPRARGGRDAAHDVRRRAHAWPRTSSESSAQHFPRTRVPDRDPPQR